MEYRDFAFSLAKQAGSIIRENFTLGMKKEYKEDTTPLTETDLKINTLLIDSVKKNFPEHSVLAEEENNTVIGSEYTWVCDPLDGTIPFSHGIPTSVFSLALVRNGKSILGVVYDPFMDRMFFAEKNKGAFLNGEKIHVSDSRSLEHEVIGLIYWDKAPFAMSDFSESLRKEKASVLDVRSVVYMGALVSNGELIGTVFPGTSAHDPAALKVLIEEAGGIVTDVFGNEQRYDRKTNGFIASNGLLHQKLIAMVGESLMAASL